LLLHSFTSSLLNFVLLLFILAFHSRVYSPLSDPLEIFNATTRTLIVNNSPGTLHDFGSKESGAIVVGSGIDCYNPGGMLDKDKDSYLRCSLEGEDRYAIIRFNEDIQLITFMLINNEQYSSNVKHFSVLLHSHLALWESKHD